MTATATSISEAYAYVLEKLSGDARVGAVYTRSQRDDHRIWILTEPLDHAGELEFYRFPTAVMDVFPDVVLTVHLVHTGRYENDLMDFVPPDAERQPLHHHE